LICVLHFADRFVPQNFLDFSVAPILAHLGVDEILVDTGELLAKNLVQNIDDLFVSLHGVTPFVIWDLTEATGRK
jgi:hypothetical protein